MTEEIQGDANGFMPTLHTLETRPAAKENSENSYDLWTRANWPTDVALT